MKNFLLPRILSVISNPVFSRAWGRIARLAKPRFLASVMIRLFARYYRIPMNGFQGQVSDYQSLGEFFIRPLDPDVRKLLPSPGSFVSPADGILSHVQKIHSDQALQVKGKTYSLSALTGESEDWEKGWLLAVIYLSPRDYHRFHYPADARLSFLRHLGGRLFPVNRLGLSLIEDLFVQNERVVAGLETSGHSWYMVAVGAAFVGGISMNDHPFPLTSGQKTFVEKNVRQNHEMGHFAMGSTIVLVLPSALAGSSCSVQSGEKVRVGDVLFPGPV